MKKIDKYVHSIFRNTNQNENDVNELKMEIKNHLYESYQELLSEGVSEEKAEIMVIERFGDGNLLHSFLKESQKTHQKFAMRLLVISAVVLVTSVISYFILSQISQNMISKQSEIGYNLSLFLKDKNEIDTYEHNISYFFYDSLVKEISIFKIEETSGSYTRNHEAAYHNQREDFFAENLYMSYSDVGTSDGSWWIEMKISQLYNFGNILLISGILIYWTIFAIGATIKVYYYRKSPLVWCFVFILTNIVGYLLFLSIRNRN